MDQLKRCNGLMLLIEYDELYFLLHDFGVQFIPIKLGNLKKIYRREKKEMQLKTCTEPVDANYNLESNDSRNVLSRCRLKLCDLSLNHTSKYSKCSRLSIHKFFIIVTLKTLASSYRKDVP